MNLRQVAFLTPFLLSLALWPLISKALSPTAAPLSELTCNTIETVPVTISNHATGEKPQSKVWAYGGTWWAVFPTNSSGASQAGTWLWKLVGNVWAEELWLSSETGTQADVLNDGDITHILLYDSSPELISVEYSNGSFDFWQERPLPSTVALSGGETAAITLDSTNRLWLIADTPSKIVAYHSMPPYDSWSSSIDIVTGITNDDIAGIITSPNHFIGVLWSDKNEKEFGFSIHQDADLPATWQAAEVAGAGSSFVDDHVNMAVSSDGRIYAAVKTSSDIIQLLVRETDGTWHNHQVDEKDIGTRPIVVLNDSIGVVTVIYTRENGFNPIVYKETNVNNIDFSGNRQTLEDGNYNDASSTKQNYSNALVIIYADSNDVAGVHCTEGIGGATQTPTSLPSPTAATSTPTATASPTTTPTVTNTGTPTPTETITPTPTPTTTPGACSCSVSLPFVSHSPFFDGQ